MIIITFLFTCSDQYSVSSYIPQDNSNKTTRDKAIIVIIIIILIVMNHFNLGAEPNTQCPVGVAKNTNDNSKKRTQYKTNVIIIMMITIIIIINNYVLSPIICGQLESARLKTTTLVR
jgi:antibiotic biosynthesis monooxygenase (ABM) superfamily enzyme